MILVVGPQPEHKDKLDEARHAWRDFFEWIGDRIPISLSEGVEIDTINQCAAGSRVRIAKTASRSSFSQSDSSSEAYPNAGKHSCTKHCTSNFCSVATWRLVLNGLISHEHINEPVSAKELQRQVLALYLWHIPDEALVERFADHIVVFDNRLRTRRAFLVIACIRELRTEQG